jgi:hypothetical protein
LAELRLFFGFGEVANFLNLQERRLSESLLVLFDFLLLPSFHQIFGGHTRVAVGVGRERATRELGFIAFVGVLEFRFYCVQSVLTCAIHMSYSAIHMSYSALLRRGLVGRCSLQSAALCQWNCLTNLLDAVSVLSHKLLHEWHLKDRL